MSLFNYHDKNLSGDICCWEIEELWREYFDKKGNGPWRFKARKLCEGFDWNGDGVLDEGEFTDLVDYRF